MAAKPQKNTAKSPGSLKGIVPKLNIGRKAQFIEATTLEGKKILLDKSKEITEPAEILNRIKYSDWFSDALARDYISTFPKRFSSARNEEERQKILSEANNTVGLYSMLVYYAYPKMPQIRKEIDSNVQYKANFSLVKGWLEGHGGNRTTSAIARHFER